MAKTDPRPSLGRMGILFIVLLLIVLDFAALRWAVDTRRPGWTVL